MIKKYFISPLYTILFSDDLPCMLERAQNYLHDIDDWLPIGETTYIRVFGAYKPPQALPMLFIDKVVLHEVLLPTEH